MASEARRWNRLADRMSYFHSRLGAEFDTIYSFSDGSFAKIMTLQAYLRMVMQFYEHLNAHHSIEEVYVFPVLAQKMPNFANNEKHKNSHKVIHKGELRLDKLEGLASSWEKEPTTFSPDTLRACLDEFRKPLFTHLDEEVRDLSAESLKKYYTLEEVDRLPM
ncbi:Hemerythrin HHE cation binding domain [Ceratobasidium sp. AG-Ba]|nr:Hemerythrin HHE cation binding domain [Ceratobasidium sp. AG-Ba]